MHVSEVSLTFFRANLRKMRKTRFIDFPAEFEFCLKNSHPRVLVLRSCFFFFWMSRNACVTSEKRLRGRLRTTRASPGVETPT